MRLQVKPVQGHLNILMRLKQNTNLNLSGCIHKLDLTYTTRQGSRVSCVAQTGFAAFGKGVQLISGSPYAETEQAVYLPPHYDK